MLHPTKMKTSTRGPVKLCGNRSPGHIDTESNTVTLDYHIDNKGQSAGWSLDYSTQSESKSQI